MKQYPYNFLINIYTQNTHVIVDEGCNGFTAINKGTVDTSINGIILKPGTGTASGESISFGGNLGEIYKGRIDVTFPSGSAGANVVIIQKIYLP